VCEVRIGPRDRSLGFFGEEKKPSLRRPQAVPQLSGFAYQKLIEAIEASAKKVGVEVRKVDPADTSVIGWVKYGSKLGLNPDQAAAFAIARRGVLSKNDAIKRRKIKGEWIDLYTKKESLNEFEVQSKESTELKCEEGKAKTAKRRGPQQSMVVSKSSTEPGWARALGSDRRQWAGKLASLRKSWSRGIVCCGMNHYPPSKQGQQRKIPRGRASL
jgi:hypothetical protein